MVQFSKIYSNEIKSLHIYFKNDMKWQIIFDNYSVIFLSTILSIQFIFKY